MRKMYVAIRQTGDFLDEIESIEEGLELIRKYEETDKAEGEFEDGYYDIENRKHETLYDEYRGIDRTEYCQIYRSIDRPTVFREYELDEAKEFYSFALNPENGCAEDYSECTSLEELADKWNHNNAGNGIGEMIFEYLY